MHSASDGLSLAQRIALLPQEQRDELMADMDPDKLLHDWSFWARPNQMPPPGDWGTWLYMAGRGSGKALDLSTPIATPDGWTAMGDLSVGDTVFDEAGDPCTVTAVYDQEAPDDGLWHITFSDGSSIDADGSHQWVTLNIPERRELKTSGRARETEPREFPSNWAAGRKTRTTATILNTLRRKAVANHCIPIAGPLNTAPSDLPIDPYLLGYWLGDGSSKDAVIYPGDHGRLRSLNLLNNKHIPLLYLRASIDQRTALLQGLMDSDGYIDKSGKRVEVVSVNERLADDILELVRSLSERPTKRKGTAKIDGIEKGPKYTVAWNATRPATFRLPRKAERYKDTWTLRSRHRTIVAVERIPDRPVRCITVDSPNAMYLAGEAMIPTHNTRTASEWIHQRVREGKAKRILLLGRTSADVRDVMLAGESGILNTGHPDEKPEYFPSKRLVVWPNGAEATLYSADEPDQLRGPQGDTAWCIAAGVPVATARGLVPVESVAVGDTVMTRAGFKTVTATRSTGVKSVLRIVAEFGEVRCTADHRVWVEGRGWVFAGSIRPGDIVTTMSAARRARVLFVEPDGSSPTYDLTVDGAHEFFAGGILVHNCDEFASFPGVGGSDGATAFDNLRLAMRLPVPGDMPRMILTTTPRRTKAMFDILDQSERPEFGIVVTKGTTYENLANLADTFRATILGLYEGTRLGQQELMGDMLADIEGALFKQEWFDQNRVDALPDGRMYAVVGVDPSVADRPTDECGIVVVKATMERDYYRRHVYVVEDASVKGSPSIWAAQVARMARKWDAPIVAEGNQGGELVRMAIAQADGNLPVHIVHAKVGKATRAEPVAALFEQGRGHVVGSLPLLESQATNWVPSESRYSPDRVDAATWAILSVVTRQKGVSFAMGRHLRARSSKAKLPALNAGSFLKAGGAGRGGRR